MTKEQQKLSEKIVTELSPAPTVYTAEAYHQNYFTINPNQGYCQMVVGPKVQKFMMKFPERLKN